jgi:pimeloyl-ACP methyl ester carboxylesterase
VSDVLLGLAWLAAQGKRRAVLVGHSFGGAVVIAAGVAAGGMVVAVAALSSQTTWSGSGACSGIAMVMAARGGERSHEKSVRTGYGLWYEVFG